MIAPTVPLAEVLKLRRDEVSVEPTSMYEMVGVRSFGRGLFTRPPILGAESSYRTLTRLHEDQVVLSRLFAWEGAVAMVTPELDGRFVSAEFPTFDVLVNWAVPSYVRHYLAWPAVHERLAGLTRGLGQRRQRVHADDFLTLEIPLLPIDEQRRVAEHLDRVRVGAHALADRSRRCDELSRAFAVSLASRPDLDDDAKSAAGWRQVRLGDVMTQVDVETPVRADDEYQIAGVYSFGRGMFARGVLQGTETAYRTLNWLSRGQVVMSRLKAWEGAIAIVPDDLDGFFVSPEFPTFEIDDDLVDAGYLRSVVTAEHFWGRLRTTSRGIGARRERVHASTLLDQVLMLPSIAEQRLASRSIDRAEVASVLRAALAERIDALLPAALNEAFAGLS